MLAGGSGMAPVLVRAARAGSGRRAAPGPLLLRGARRRGPVPRSTDRRARRAAAGLRFFTPGAVGELEWRRGLGRVRSPAASRVRAGDLEAYMCGPPPMIDAASEMLVDVHGVDETRIHSRQVHDRPPTPAQRGRRDHSEAEPTAPAGDDRRSARSSGTAAQAPRASLYEDVTMRHPAVGPPPRATAAGRMHLRGRPRHLVGRVDGASRSGDWYAFRDPGEHVGAHLLPAGHGGGEADRGRRERRRSASGCSTTSTRVDRRSCAGTSRCLPSSTTASGSRCASAGRAACPTRWRTASVLEAAMKQRSAQAIVLYGMDLDTHFGDFPIEPLESSVPERPAWQPRRSYLERLRATTDWGERDRRVERSASSRWSACCCAASSACARRSAARGPGHVRRRPRRRSRNGVGRGTGPSSCCASCWRTKRSARPTREVWRAGWRDWLPLARGGLRRARAGVRRASGRAPASTRAQQRGGGPA